MKLKGFYNDARAKQAMRIKPVSLSELRKKVESGQSLSTVEEQKFLELQHRVHHTPVKEKRTCEKFIKI
jgi:hypothetical protein